MGKLKETLRRGATRARRVGDHRRAHQHLLERGQVDQRWYGLQLSA